MHDEVSETENIRKNLAIERMIVDGCELLLDVNQVFVRQGTLIQVVCDKPRSSRTRLGTFGGSARDRKEAIRQVFLFTNHLLITARTNNGRLRLVKNYGKISLVECTLVEDTTAELFSTEDDGFTNLDSEKKLSDQNWASTRTTVTSPPPHSASHQQVQSPGAPTNHSRSSTTTVPSSMDPLVTVARFQARSESGPSVTLNTAFGFKRSGQIERATRHMSGSVLPSASTLTSIGVPETPTGASLAAATTATKIEVSPQHRHSTSLCAAPSESDAIGGASRTSGMSGFVYTHQVPGSGQFNEPSCHTTVTATPVTTIPAHSVPLIHRFSSNFAILSSTSTQAPNNGGNTNSSVPLGGNFGTNMVDKADYGNLDFRIIWEPKNGQPTSIWLVASTLQEKAAWCSDISQCIEQLHYGDLLNSAQSDVSSIAMPQSIRSDPRLFKDDVDIKFSHTLNSCKVPQIRHASVGRLLDRLTDARFLSIDFLNTFLLTYRVFTTGLTVIYALENVLSNPELEGAASSVLLQGGGGQGSQSSCYSELSTGREPGTGRTSEAAGIPRLPVLEEKQVRTEDELLKSEERTSESEDVVIPQSDAHISTQEVPVSNDTGDSVTGTVKRRPDKIHTRPLSTSEAPNPLSPTTLRPDSQVDLQRMFRSATSYESTMDKESGIRHSVGNVQILMKSSDRIDQSQSVAANSSAQMQPQPPPPPLIPRSPVFRGLFNIRDDPPLELPILPNLKKTDKSIQLKEKSQRVTEVDQDLEKAQQNPHLRLAPLASCEVIADEVEQLCQSQLKENHSSDINSSYKIEFELQDAIRENSHSISPELIEKSCSPVKQLDVCADNATSDGKVPDSLEENKDSNCSQNPEPTEEQNKPKASIDQRWSVLSAETTDDSDIFSNVPTTETQHNETNSVDAQDKTPVNTCESTAVVNQLAVITEPPTTRFTSSYCSIADSLDLATRRIRRKETNPKGACETLAKTAMLAALHCPSSLIRIQPNDDGIGVTEQKSKTIELHSSPSSPIKRQNGTGKIQDIKCNLSVQLSPNECSSPAKSPNKFSGPRRFFARNSHHRSSERYSDTEQRKPSSVSEKTSSEQDQSHPPQIDRKDAIGRRPNSATNRIIHNLGESKTPGDKPTRGSHGDEHIGEKNIQEQLMGTVKLMACTFGGTEEIERARHTSDRFNADASNVERTASSTPRSSLTQPQTNLADYARGSVVSWSGVSETPKPKRPSVFSCPDTEVMSARHSVLPPTFGENPALMRTRAGAVVTSSRRSKRRSSNTAAAQAFAVATAGSASPLAAAGIMGLGPSIYRTGFRFSAGTASSAASSAGTKPVVSSTGTGSTTTTLWTAAGAPFSSTTNASTLALQRYSARSCSAASTGSQSVTGPLVQTKVTTCTPIHWTQPLQTRMDQQNRRSNIMATASCLRVLNVVRHWITKFPDDFDSDPILKSEMKNLLELLVCCPHLIVNDQKAAGQLLRQMVCDQLVQNRIDLDAILTPIQIPSEKNFDTLSALDISEQLTFLDFQIFRSIRSEELLNQSWMKPDKEDKAKHVLLVCKRFNEVSRLVVSEIISRTELNDRVMCIDKWVAIADICRCMQNYNGVLQICAALVNSSVYRLRRTWERVSKQTKQSIDRLQMLVASDGRFKSMREALHRCDPPCIPYLGMYLTDLSFIEEGALNITENNLVNFCKMRMIAHVIREIQQYHQTPYLITHRREVTDYLLDPTRLLDEEQTYQASLTIEPRQSINRQPSGGVT